MKFFQFLILTLLISCSDSKTELDAQQIIDKTIIASGSELLNTSKLTFKFRDKFYSAERNNGAFLLSRSFDSITDELSNKRFVRKIRNEELILPDSIANNFKNAVNSVHYFAVLPYGLNDQAVIKKKLNSIEIKGTEFYKIEIRFSEEGGGEDFDDVFVYWINKENFLIHYLAYQFHTNGGGFRFREVTSEIMVNGVRFVNYDNYKPNKPLDSLKNIDTYFLNGDLVKISEINLEDIQLERLAN